MKRGPVLGERKWCLHFPKLWVPWLKKRSGFADRKSFVQNEVFCRNMSISSQRVKKTNIQSLRKTFRLVPTYWEINFNINFLLQMLLYWCQNAQLFCVCVRDTISTQRITYKCWLFVLWFETREVLEIEVSCKKFYQRKHKFSPTNYNL